MGLTNKNERNIFSPPSIIYQLVLIKWLLDQSILLISKCSILGTILVVYSSCIRSGGQRFKSCNLQGIFCVILMFWFLYCLSCLVLSLSKVERLFRMIRQMMNGLKSGDWNTEIKTWIYDFMLRNLTCVSLGWTMSTTYSRRLAQY